MKRRGFTGVEAPLVVGLVGIAASVVVPILSPMVSPVFSRASDSARRASCQSNLKQIALGVMQYTQDYDEKFPLIKASRVSRSVTPYPSPYGWADALQPYLKSTQLYQCPNEKHPANPSKDAVQANFVDYWYNGNLKGLELVDINAPASTLLNGDGNDGSDLTNARYNKTNLPSSWFTNSHSPLYRHLNGANYSFLDGHVKWYRPGAVQLTRLSSSRVSRTRSHINRHR